MIVRKYSNTAVKNAGITLISEGESTDAEIHKAEDTLTYWRSIHSPILNTFQAMLRKKLSEKIKNPGFIAQRLKRSTSIVAKLQREHTMKLSTMNDIAGIRAVMTNIKDVYELTSMLEKSRFKHKLKKKRDYINDPKESGYRSIHLIFEYYHKNQPESNGLSIEVQLRTKLQHTWATTVETLETFTKTSLKSSVGPKDILDFLCLTSSAFALHEDCPINPIHKEYTPEKLNLEVLNRYNELKIEEKLKGFSVAADHINKINKKKYHYYLITLNIKDRIATVKPFLKSEFSLANEKYTETERSIKEGSPLQVVLVSTDKISALKKAYPNYFLDTSQFIKQIERLKA